MINKKNKFIALAVTAALFLWLVEVFLHVVIFHTGNVMEELLPLHDADELWMRIIIVIVLLVAGAVSQRMANTISEAYEREQEIAKKLEASIKEIKLLRGIVPICASCKKIKDDKGYWNQVEAYIAKHSQVQFSHGLCPECAKKLYPELSKIF